MEQRCLNFIHPAMAQRITSSHNGEAAVREEIRSARRIATMLTDPDDQAIVETYIMELALKAGECSGSWVMPVDDVGVSTGQRSISL